MVDETSIFRSGILVSVTFLLAMVVMVYARIAFRFRDGPWLLLMLGGTVLGITLVGVSIFFAAVRKLLHGLVASNS